VAPEEVMPAKATNKINSSLMFLVNSKAMTEMIKASEEDTNKILMRSTRLSVRATSNPNTEVTLRKTSRMM
jgi:hypothetical protein